MTNKIEDIVIAKEDLEQALKDSLGRRPKKAELKRFRDFCVMDVGDWISDNVKSFLSRD